MKNIIKILWSAVLLILMQGCEKAITIHLPDSPPELVVEGYIYSGQPPIVILTHSLGFFSEINADIVDSSYIHGALITVSNGLQTQTLKEYSIDTTDGNTVFFYSSDTTKGQSIFVGVPGDNYALNIQLNGQDLSATTSIPAGGDTLDSLWVVHPNDPADSGKAILMGEITDPPQPGNDIRYFTKIDSGPYLPGLNSVYDDELINGTTYSTRIEPGFDKSDPLDSSTHGFFHQGDTVTVELCNIDLATYNFWRTYDYSYSNTGNPFSSPTQILGNVPGALGYWGGYEQQFQSIIIP